MTSGVGEDAKAEVKGEGEIEVGGTEAKVKGESSAGSGPIVGCISGQVQKIPQHFQIKHRLPNTSKASLTLRKHKCAPPQEATNNLTPTSHARHRLGSSWTLTEFVTPGPSRELPEYVPLETRSAVSVKRGRVEVF